MQVLLRKVETKHQSTPAKFVLQTAFLLLNALGLLILGHSTTASVNHSALEAKAQLASIYGWVANTTTGGIGNVTIASETRTTVPTVVQSPYRPLNDDIANGSTRHSPYPGIDVLSYVCVEPQPWRFHTYGNDTWKGYNNKPLEEWQWDSHPDNCTFVDDPTLFFVDMVVGPAGNPAHCLNDVIFSLIHQHPQPENSTAPTFPSYMYGTTWRMPQILKKECDETLSWCCNVMKRAGWIPKYHPPVFPIHPHTQPICFRSLVRPKTEAFRHRPDPSSLEILQNRLAKSGQLPETKWTQQELTSTPQHVFLYDRHGSRRRRYNNSEAFVDYLQKHYHVVVHRVGQEWNLLKPAAQAAMYNAYPNIIAPHGAHLANLIYVRPGTRVVEMQCEIHGNAAIQNRSASPLLDDHGNKLTREDDPLWFGRPAHHREGHTSWHISLSDNLDVEHYVYVEKNGCEIDDQGRLDRKYSPAQFNVDPVEFGEYVATRFGLQAK